MSEDWRPSLISAVSYKDPRAALAFLEKAFGFELFMLIETEDGGVAHSEKVPLDRKKTYTLTGFARAKSGTAKIKIDYYQGDMFLGLTESDEVTTDKWQQLKVVAEPGKFPEATHILACAVACGEFEASFDDFVMTAKEGK